MALIGRQIGRYKILSLLGVGGMGEVYRARDTTLGRDVAIKVLPSMFTSDEPRLARFQREARTLAALNHPHIASIYGTEDEGDLHAIVLELVDGATLADRIAKGAIPLKETLRIAREIADALDGAHDKGIVHRDLKPANVKLTASGAVKVLDFGLAKAAAGVEMPDDDSSQTLARDGTREGIVLGTPAYMSPEQARGQPIDKRADVWAFGCVLFEMLTGHAPFDRPTVSEILAAVIERDVDFSMLPASTPGSVRRVLRRCLEKDPAFRLRDIGDARFDLTEEAAEQPTSPLPAVRRHHAARNAAAVMLLVAIVAAAAAIGWIVARQRGGTVAQAVGVRSSILLSDFEDLTGSPSQHFSLSPDGTRLAVAVRGSDGRSELWIRPLDKNSSIHLDGAEDALAPFWSPDGDAVGYFSGMRLMTIPASGGTPSRICDLPAGAANAITGEWGRAGILFSFNGTGTAPIYRADLQTRQCSPATSIKKGETSHYWPTFVDDRHFAYVAIGSQGSPALKPVGVYLASLDAPDVTLLLGGGSHLSFDGSRLFFLRERTLVAQRLNMKAAQLEGEPTVIADDIQSGGPAASAGAFGVSHTGVVAYQQGTNEVITDLRWFNRDGKPVATVGGQHEHVSVRLAPDGGRIAEERHLAGTGDLWIVNARDGTDTKFTFDGKHSTYPVWSPDGRRVVFRSAATTSGPSAGLYIRATDGAGEVEPFFSAAVIPEDWSSDGRYVIFDRLADATKSDIWALPLAADGRRLLPLPIVQSAAWEQEARISQDGRWIAYTSDESGEREVYVRPFPSGPGQWLVSSHGGEAPRWRRDGKELFYVSGNRAIVAAPVTPGAVFKSGAGKVLFEARLVRHPSVGQLRATLEYDVSADGQRFLLNSPSGTAAPIQLIVNWKP
jgi:serine/threonine protein kinase